MTTMNVYTPADPARNREMIKALTHWYNANRRDLPWRGNTDAYSIWICEIMAQQTQIATVTPYFEKFMRLFPTVQALAAAPVEAVLKAWEGLGYYARAHHLHNAAKMVTADYGGRLPETEKELRRLPGIGDYTAGAILSIAYGQPVPAVDGNVLRVFARFENNEMDVAKPGTKRALTVHLKGMMPTSGAGTFTQSLMELGALICTPKSPNCGACPIAGLCKALHAGRENELPVKTVKGPQKKLHKTVLLIIDQDGGVLMRKRTERLLRGLWVFYMADGKLDGGEALSHAKSLGAGVTDFHAIDGVRHVFTHIIWEMEGYVCRIETCPAPEGYTFVTPETLRGLTVPVAHTFFLNYFQSKIV